MKNLIFLLVMLASAAAFGQSTTGALLVWEKNSYDFGEIPEGDKVEFTFKFVNGGTEPLIITNVTTQCGCTAPRGWPRDPVLPGGKGEITISFNSSGKFGRINKVATVVSNAANKEKSQLLLSGSVLEKKTQ